MSRLRKWFIIVVTVWVSLGVVVGLVRLIQGEGKFIYDARVTEFFICKGPDLVTGVPREIVGALPSTSETIWVCGYLQADGYVPLHFVLFYEGESTKWYNSEKNYQTGWIYKELPGNWRKIGSYRVEVWLHGHELAATDFTLVP